MKLGFEKQSTAVRPMLVHPSCICQMTFTKGKDPTWAEMLLISLFFNKKCAVA